MGRGGEGPARNEQTESVALFMGPIYIERAAAAARSSFAFSHPSNCGAVAERRNGTIRWERERNRHILPEPHVE